jgi:hypothetical protein
MERGSGKQIVLSERNQQLRQTRCVPAVVREKVLDAGLLANLHVGAAAYMLAEDAADYAIRLSGVTHFAPGLEQEEPVWAWAALGAHTLLALTGVGAGLAMLRAPAAAAACCVRLQACFGPIAAFGYAASGVALAERSLSRGAPGAVATALVVAWAAYKVLMNALWGLLAASGWFAARALLQAPLVVGNRVAAVPNDEP